MIKSLYAVFFGSIVWLSLDVSCALANIGDTRRHSDLRYGKPSFGLADGFKYRNYVKAGWDISSLFSDQGYCVYIQYSRADGSNISEDEIAMLLRDNLIGDHQWERYPGNANYLTWFDGGLFYAMYCFQPQTYPDGRTRTAPTLRISNQATLSALGLFKEAKPSEVATADVNAI